MEYGAQMAGLVEWAEVQNVSALIVFSATTAKAVICEMLRRGVKVPEDLSVLAFGSFDFDSEFNIPISSIDIDIPSIVSHAVRLLSESMQGKEIHQKQFAIRSELTLRGSVIHAH
jgi:LacI family transcriptional regulator